MVSDGTLRVYQRVDEVGEAAEDNADKAGKGEGNVGEVSFYAILDGTEQPNLNATLVLKVPIGIFITADLELYASVLGKESMDMAQCVW